MYFFFQEKKVAHSKLAETVEDIVMSTPEKINKALKVWIATTKNYEETAHSSLFFFFSFFLFFFFSFFSFFLFFFFSFFLFFFLFFRMLTLILVTLPSSKVVPPST